MDSRDRALVRTTFAEATAAGTSDRDFRALQNRVKELSALHAATQILQEVEIPEAEALRRIALLVPPVFHHAGDAAARLVRGAETIESPGYRDTAWKLSAPFRTSDGRDGAIEAVYLRDHTTPSGGPFHAEERTFLESLAALVAMSLDRRGAHERLAMALTGNVRLWDWDLAANRLAWPDIRVGRPPRILFMTYEEALAHVHPDDRPAVQATVDAALQGPRRRDHVVVQCRVAWSGPEYRWRHITGRVYRDRTRRPVRMLGFSTDITDQRTLQDRLRQVEKMEALGRLAGGITHDFSNVLVAVHGFGQVALDHLPPGHPARPHVDEILKAGQTAQQLIRQIVAFSRRQELSPRRIDLRAAVGEWDGMIRRLLGSRFEFRIDPSSNPPVVYADPGQLFQVVLNLSINARDAMPDGGTITLRTASRRAKAPHDGPAAQFREWAMIEIQDTGIGMPPEVLRHVFEPFYTTKAEGNGTGLGLATVHGIVTQSGGFLEVESAVGEGTLFRIHLPTAPS